MTTTPIIYTSPELEELRQLMAGARAKLAALETDYTKEKSRVDTVQAVLFGHLREHYQKRDQLRLMVDYRQKFLKSLTRGNAEEAKRAEENFEQAKTQSDKDYEELAAAADKKKQLTEEEEAELSQLWKKLVKLYHTDLFANEPDKLEAYHKLTCAINQAKEDGDIELLREIGEDPEGFLFLKGWATLDFSDKEELTQLRRLHETLQKEISAVTESLEKLRERPDYKLCKLAEQKPGVLDELAAERIKQLETEIAELEIQAEQLARELVKAGENAKDQMTDIDGLKKAATAGDTKAQFDLGVCYTEGDGVPQDYAEAVKWFRKAADQGNPIAQYNLGLLYIQGRGVPQDYGAGIKWYGKAADQNYAQAQFAMGVAYGFGIGVPQNFKEAVKWFQKAAELGHAEAQYKLGNCYDNGTGVWFRNKSEAVKWYRKSADQNFAEAQYSLGNCYLKGDGVAKNYVEAVKWLRKAADQGNADAQHDLGWCYGNGEGVPQDYAEAVKWYRKAAEQGHADAQNGLGNRYYKGDGVTRNLVEAYKWFSLASAQGNEIAKKNVQMCRCHRWMGVAYSMTPDQIAEAEKLTREFKPHTESASINSKVPV